MPFSVERSLNELPLARREAARARIDDLWGKQRARGMVPRDDSKLSFLFATEESNESVNDVARELCTVNYIYENTAYSALLEDVMRELASQCRKKYKLSSWTETWKILRFYAPTLLKLYCVRTSNVDIPDHLPGSALVAAS